MPEPLDPTQWPKWKHHLTLESVMVATPDEEAALPDGYRDTGFSEEERYEYAKAAHAQAVKSHTAQVKALEDTLQTPVDIEPPPTPARDTGSHLRPPPKRKRPKTRIRR